MKELEMKKAELEIVQGALRQIKNAGRMAVLVRTLPSGKRATEVFAPEGIAALELEVRGRLVLGAVWVFEPHQGTLVDDPAKELTYYATNHEDRGERAMAFLTGVYSEPGRQAPGNAWYVDFLRANGRLNWNPPSPNSIGTPEWFAPLGRAPTDGEVATARQLQLVYAFSKSASFGTIDFGQTVQ